MSEKNVKTPPVAFRAGVCNYCSVYVGMFFIHVNLFDVSASLCLFSEASGHGLFFFLFKITDSYLTNWSILFHLTWSSSSSLSQRGVKGQEKKRKYIRDEYLYLQFQHVQMY